MQSVVITSSQAHQPPAYPKLFVWLGLVVLTLILASSFWASMSINHMIESAFEESGSYISEGLANAVAENLITKDYAAIEVNVRHTLSNSNILSAAITDPAGKVIINMKRAEIGKLPNLDFGNQYFILEGRGVKPYSENEATTIVSWTPIVRGIHIGWVRVEISKTSSVKILSTLRFNLLIALFLSLGLAVVLSIWKLRIYILNVSRWNKSVVDTNVLKEREVIHSHLIMMEALGQMVAKRDSETGAHNYRVTYIAIRIAEELGYKGVAMQSLITGSFLHDIGKVAIPDSILLKPGALSDAEWVIMKAHVTHGEQMVKHIGWLSKAHEIVANHHEKWNGTGYPRGISGADIPISARIFMVADSFDALCSERPYKKAFDYDESMKIINQESQSHFDPQLVHIFSSISRVIYDELASLSKAEIKALVAGRLNLYFFNN